ncbi:MAG TPA: PAS domain S-box protein [Gemmatimonadaceae bacterium]|jgi:PAS domain S-box-containing protein|nr:PAS domain S-box protein [Gemmatimonadaceae bacterium]
MSRPEKSFRTSPAVQSDSELSFADAFENAPHAMALVNPSGRLLSANRALCRMLGYARDELVRTNISSLTHPDDFETDWEQRQRLARADIGRYELTQRYLRKNGEAVWVRLSVSAARRTSFELAYFVVQAEAVAPPRCSVIAEGESQSLRRFGDATLSAMHEIGNTLTPLMMNAELIVEQSANDPMKACAHEIFKAARRIAFTLRRLRKIEDHQPVAYIGSDRLLDLRMVPPPSPDTDGEVEDASLDTGT